MAISIDNARIHNQLEKLLEERSNALNIAETQIRAILESSPLGIALTSYEGEFLSINNALQDMLRISEDELHQWRVGDFYADPAERGTLLAELRELGFVQNFGVQLTRKDGDLFFGSVNTSRLVLQGNEALLSIVEDVTDKIAAKQQTAVAIERERLARELHDAVTQTLFSASVIAEAAPVIWETDQAMGRQYLEQLPTLLRGALAEMRSLLLELRPQAFKNITLGQLIEPLADTSRAYTHAEVTLEVESDLNTPEDVTRNLHRIVQECLEASQIDIYLCSNQEGVEIRISDNGLGFDTETIPPGSMGIDIMRDRARKIDAKLKITSQPGNGTQIMIHWSGQENTQGEN
jgi:PAS domain S-box-containing protein